MWSIFTILTQQDLCQNYTKADQGQNPRSDPSQEEGSEELRVGQGGSICLFPEWNSLNLRQNVFKYMFS